MSVNTTSIVMQRQEPLRKRYRENPGEAQITDYTQAASLGSDPFHGTFVAGDSDTPLDFGIHRAIGGDHDLPNPGDILCAALATCLDSTLRMIAARMDISLETLEVEVKAFADVRGCLMVDKSVPVGFQRINVNTLIKAEKGADPAQIGMLISTAERCCVILQTLRGDVPVELNFNEPSIDEAAE